MQVVALIGRPNVGKSTLFNQLTRSRDALVYNQPGVTRDRMYGQCRLNTERPFWVVDTGGLQSPARGAAPSQALKKDEASWLALQASMSWQTEQALSEALIIVFIVDARAGLTPLDLDIAAKLRHFNKPIVVVANKTDGLKQPDAVLNEFLDLGFGLPLGVAAAHARGLDALLSRIETELQLHRGPEDELDSLSNMDQQPSGRKLAIVGKPNVGKSTLVNRMLGDERVIVCDLPGTTRDSIFIPFTNKQGQSYVLIDTAGVRRKARVKEALEQFSILKTLQAIELSDVVIFIADVREGITDQDLKLLDLIVEMGKPLVFALNKIDQLSSDDKKKIKQQLNYVLKFMNFVTILNISALHGTGVGHLYKACESAYRSAGKLLKTADLTKVLEKLVERHQPPLCKGRRIKLKYANPGGTHPPTIVIHGNQTENLPAVYRKYLLNGFREAFNLQGTPIKLIFKTPTNPYV